LPGLDARLERRPAPSVLDAPQWKHNKLSWRLYYGPDTKSYALNIHAVDEVPPGFHPPGGGAA